MNIFDGIEKLITEHGSAAILSQQLSFARDQFAGLERKVSDLQTQVGRLEAQLERECVDHKQARQDFQRLQDEHAEEVRIHGLVEFRRGKRTGGRWQAFCPQCHMPVSETRAQVNGQLTVFCTGGDWHVRPRSTLETLIGELDS